MVKEVGDNISSQDVLLLYDKFKLWQQFGF